MSWLKKIPWLSLSLLVLTYTVFGWIVARSSLSVSDWLIEQGKVWGWLFERNWLVLDIHLVAVGLILLLGITLTAPIAILKMFLGSWFTSDTKALLSMLAWAFAVVLIMRWIGYFARFLVLLCATILGQMELQQAGYNQWQTFIILTLFCLSGFGIGIMMFRVYVYS